MFLTSITYSMVSFGSSTKSNNAEAIHLFTLAASAGAVTYFGRKMMQYLLLAPSSKNKYDRVLVSLPYSHFVESARWALERRGLRVKEVKVPIGPHVLVAMTYRLCFPEGISSHSSFPGQQSSHRKASNNWSSKLMRLTTVPFFRRLSGVPLAINTKTKTILPDSWSVLNDCNLAVRNAQLKQRWDEDLGPAVRQVVYYYILNLDGKLYRQVQSCGKGWMMLFDMCEGLFRLSSFMKPMMEMNPADVEDAKGRIRREFQLVSRMLNPNSYGTKSKPRREIAVYLGDGTTEWHTEFGGADLAFCALVGWLLLPEHFHNGQVDVPSGEKIPKEMRDFMDELTATKAAQHVQYCYQHHRREMVRLPFKNCI